MKKITLTALLSSLLWVWGTSVAAQTDDNVDESKTEQTTEQAEIDTQESAEEARLKIVGIEDEKLLENVQIYVRQLDNGSADLSERYQYLVQQEMDKALRALGYYNTQYHFSVTPAANGKTAQLTVNVQLDQSAVKIRHAEIVLEGEAQKDPDVQKLLKTAPLAGTVLNHEQYEDFKSAVDSLLYRKGYFDGQWRYHRLEVYPSEHFADWRLGYHSGARYHYGEIRFRDSQIWEDYLQNILRIKSGDAYLASDLATLSSDFSSTNWFSSVLVEPQIDSQKKLVDLNVLLRPRKKNDVEVGVGFATDVGPRFQFNWKKPWLNRRGDSLEVAGYVSKPEQSLEVGYNIPVKSSPLYYYHQFSAGVAREDQNDTEFVGAHLGYQRFWNKKRGWSFSLGAKARYDAFTQARDKFSTLLLYPTASASYLRTDGNRFPLWGEKMGLTVDWGSKMWGSDVNFQRAKANVSIVRNLRSTHRLFVRGELGYLNAGEFPRIPPSLRFFAGGDMSVRGFGYKDISPRNRDGKLTGGSRLATATLEYQYRVYQNWWAAVFYDTGFSAKRFSTEWLHSGAGIGVRWASPIGAIKFDLATPVRSPNNEKGVQFYIGLGSEL